MHARTRTTTERTAHRQRNPQKRHTHARYERQREGLDRMVQQLGTPQHPSRGCQDPSPLSRNRSWRHRSCTQRSANWNQATDETAPRETADHAQTSVDLGGRRIIKKKSESPTFILRSYAVLA